VSVIPSFRAFQGAPLIRLGLVLAVPALVALSVLSSTPASAAARDTRPSAPGLVIATAGDNTAIVKFVAPFSNGGSRVTVYYIKEYGRNSAIRRCNSTRCTILGLSNGIGYRFVVAAVNRFGRSAYSAPSPSVTPTAPGSTTPPPTNGTTATVTFDANGGAGDMASETEDLNVATPLSANTFAYVGYTFAGWNTSPTGGGAGYANDATYPFATSVTLYAQWTATSVFEGTSSTNWSGYVLPSDSIFTAVSAEWTVPTLNCADTPNANSATWVGTGGVTWSNGDSSGSLLQTGTIDDCVNGVQQDSGVFELLPSTPNYAETFNDFPVNAGDVISAEVSENSSGQWATFVENLTTGLEGVFGVGLGWEVETISTHTVKGGLQGVATSTSYSGAYSAEWIEEDPENVSAGSSLFSFANYGNVRFSNVETSLPSGWTLPNTDGTEIVQNGTTLSIPGIVSDDGFMVTYTGP